MSKEEENEIVKDAITKCWVNAGTNQVVRDICWVANERLKLDFTGGKHETK